ncbi:MAG TPA: DUF3943 domain-containing protein [Usitatibacter sp.]|nr:DUF3943 domain-containing protein [Usitatibacter sp.]
MTTIRNAVAAAALACAASAHAADDPPANTVPRALGLTPETATVPARPEKPDFAAEIEARKSYWIPAAEIVGFDFLLNRFDKQYFGCCDFDVTARTVRRNLRSSWVVDRDPFMVNQLGHPYQGSMYHGFARASGLDFWEGLGYTFLGSAFWEIAGETTPPSRNDQVNTGIGGAFLGEALFRISNLLLERGDYPKWLRETAAAAVSPPVGFNRLAFGDRFDRPFPSRAPAFFSRLQLGFSGTSGNDSGTSRTSLRRNEALADFYLDYGMPGKRDYEYTRPFDYFSFQATASSANGFENVMTRGLLKGRSYGEGADTYRGVYGLYGHYDYIAPQTFRVSSTALSLGTTLEWRPRDFLVLQGTAAGGVGYAAAGSIRSVAENDFSYGLAPHALLSMRAIYGARLALDVTARQYYVTRVAAASHGGNENIARVDAALTWRVHDRHGISVKYLANRRDASYPDLPGVKQRRETIGLFYTLLGRDRFGAVDWR